MIAADQPGVGGSTPQSGRKMVDWGADMEQLADALHLDKFAVAGHSGGGPHTLSIAVRMPDRVTHGVLASPVGPFDRNGFAKMLVMKDLKLIVKLPHFHHIIKWAIGLTSRKPRKTSAVSWRQWRRTTSQTPTHSSQTQSNARCSRRTSLLECCKTKRVSMK
jgi:pimeloyl-ACP methyl ester carboxylesterase